MVGSDANIWSGLNFPSSNALKLPFWKNITDYPSFQKALNGNISINCQYYGYGLLDEWLIFTKTLISAST